MQNSKLIDLLKTFEKEDWRWFRKFLLSPYFNSREELVPFCDYLRKQAPDFNEKTIRKEKVFKKLFPKETYDEKKISYSMNFLLGQAERFLAQREIETKPPLLNNYLLNSLVNRNLNKHYKYHYEKSLKTLENWKRENIDYYYYEFQLSEIANSHFIAQKLRRYDESLQNVSNSLNQLYAIQKIKYSCEMLSRSKLLKDVYTPPSKVEINELIKKGNLQQSPLALIFLEIFSLSSEEDSEQNFEQLKYYLEEYKDTIPKAEKRNIYLHGTNYCIVQITKNNRPRYYVQECLNLYLAGIEQEFLLSNGFLTPSTFKNVVKLGLNLKKYDFTEEFIQNNYKKLEEKFQEDVLHFNLADINYRKKNYKEAQVHLIQALFSDVYYNISAKAMLLKIYYETNEGEALFALIASFSIYLRRNKKITKNVRESYLNFTTILGRIVRAHKEKYPAIIEKINNTKHLYNRNWLLEICQPKRKVN